MKMASTAHNGATRVSIPLTLPTCSKSQYRLMGRPYSAGAVMAA